MYAAFDVFELEQGQRHHQHHQDDGLRRRA
jgi:hypothetical protein